MLFEPSAAEIESAVLRALATGADVATSQREFAAGFRRDHQTARLAAMLDALVSDRAAPKKTAAPGAPFFSVVIPVHNKAPHVHRSVTSVLNQSFQDFEVIAIDDASTDGSLAEIQQFADSRIRILRRGLPGPGGYAARNLGIREARAEWIALLDADDEWLPDHLEKMSDLARQFPGSSILSSGWTTVLPGNRRVVDPYFAANRFRGPHTLSFGQYLQESINTRRPIHTSVACLKRTSETARNVFPEGRARRGGDLHAWVMVLAHGTMAWSAHLGAVYYRDTVNMVTRSVPLSVDLHRAVVEDVRPFVGKSEIKLLRKYSNRRIFAAWLGQRLNGNAPYNVPANLMWKGDALYCLTRSVVSFIPVGALKRMRSLRRLTRR
jgi:glycosyltransferase involved in cell wall biosynthesis